MQRRLVRKLDLEVALSRTQPHPSPKAYLEQYTIPPDISAELLYLVAYTYDNIIGKTIMDLGCGTGRLAIGSVLLGAEEAIGVDIDRVATRTAFANANNLNVEEKTQWITTDIATIRGRFDTVVQNPPFGVQRRKADQKFLAKALEIGKHIYSLHKSYSKPRDPRVRPPRGTSRVTPSSPSPFLERIVERHGGTIKAVYNMRMTIPHLFVFHRKRKHQFPIDLYVIEG